MTKLFYKIPPYLPFPSGSETALGRRPKGGIIPLFGKEGLGEIFRRICPLNDGLIGKQQRGMALVIALVMLLVLTLVGLSALTTTNFETNISGNQRVYNMAFYTADGGVENFRGRVSGGEFIYSAVSTGSYQVGIGGNTCNVSYEKWNRSDSEGDFTVFKITSEGRAPFPSTGRVEIESIIEVLTTIQPGYN